jgi:hypothetical protein
MTVAYLTIIAVLMVNQPLPLIAPIEGQELRADVVRAPEVVYFDAPIRSVPTLLR